jgi:hypothetical protein
MPVIFQSAPGRFEVAAMEAVAAQRVAAEATEAWRHLAGPLGLPESFAAPVMVRLVPAPDWAGMVPFRVFVEAGGVVSVRIRWSEEIEETIIRRALVQGLLMRLAVSRHGVSAQLTAPLWLEQACVGWWRIHAVPAQLDALKQRTAKVPPPPLTALLGWTRGEEEPGELTDGAVWLLSFLQAESARGVEWASALPRLLGGDPAAVVLAASFSGKFADERERELWWQTGWHHLRRARTLPGLESGDSRAELMALSRFVCVRQEKETVLPLRDVLAHAGEPAVGEELARRAATLNHVVAGLHPFYRNAGLSLAEALNSPGAKPERRAALAAAFEQEWRDATEIEAAAAAVLDAWAAKR